MPRGTSGPGSPCTAGRPQRATRATPLSASAVQVFSDVQERTVNPKYFRKLGGKTRCNVQQSIRPQTPLSNQPATATKTLAEQQKAVQNWKHFRIRFRLLVPNTHAPAFFGSHFRGVHCTDLTLCKHVEEGYQRRGHCRRPQSRCVLWSIILAEPVERIFFFKKKL